MGTAAPDPSNELATAAAPPKRGNRVKGLFRFVYGLIRVVLILFLALLAAGTAIEFVVPKGPLRKLCVQRLQARLHRQVAIAAVSIGPWRGLNVEGLQVSEAPDFGAGTFFKSERVMVRPRFLPLLAGRVVVGRVLLVAPQLRVVRDKTGRYNFGSLVEASVAASTAAAKPSFDVVGFFTKGWALDRLDVKIKQVGELFAAAGGAAAGKLAAAVARLDLDVEELRVRRGTLEYADEEAPLKMTAAEVTVWAEGLTPRSPRSEISVDGKAAGTVHDQPAEAEFMLDARMELDKNYYPVASVGHLTLNKIRHPNFQTDRVRAEWDLRGLSPDLLTTAGVVKLEGSAGQLINPAFISKQGKWPGLLLYPVEVLAKFRGLNLPDMAKIEYTELRGEYSFQNGAVNLAPLYIRGPVVSINAEGALNLPLRTVGLKANVIMGKSSMGVTVKGLMDAPSVEAEVSFKAPPKKSQTVHQVVEKKQKDYVLQQHFGDANALVTEEMGGPAKPRKPGAKAGAKSARKETEPADRPRTLKDVENIIDAPLPE